MPQVGYRFYPTEQELLEYYLFNKITQNPLLYEDGDIPVIDCDLYGTDEPSVIWEMYGGNRLLKGQDLYFFTRLKKLSPKAKNFYRKIASGAWQGEDGAKPVEADGSGQIVGFKRRFRYESKRNHKDDGGWIMHEFTINSSLLGHQYSHQALDIVLCHIKKNESGQRKERANLGKKQRNSSEERASGNKRKLKEVATPNSNGDQDDEIAPNKRSRAGPEVALFQQNQTPCSSKTMQAVEYEGELMESLPEDSTSFDHHDEGVWVVEEAIDLPCSNTNMQTVEVEGDMESLPEDFDSFYVEEYSSMLAQILEHDGADCGDDEGFQCKQLRGAEEGAPLVEQNQPTDLPRPYSSTPIMELPVEALASDIEEVFSTLGEIKEVGCIEDHDGKFVLSKQLEEAIDLPCSNTNMQTVEVEGDMESLPEDFDSFYVEEYSSMLAQILEHDGADCGDDEGIQCKQLRGAEEGAPLVQQNHPTDLPRLNSNKPVMELPVEALAPVDNEVFSTLGEITEVDCMGGKFGWSKQLRGLEEVEALDSAEFTEFISGVDQVLDQLFPGWNN